jgi:hypothetical protein
MKTRSGPRTFRPGEIIRVDPAKARPFVEKGYLRPASIQVGSRIEWKSPILGTLSGPVTALLPDAMIQVDHPLTGERAVIPREWVRRVIQ